jgi:ribokinase
MAGMICVLGDAHLDVVTRIFGPMAEETDTPATTHCGVGGQAANVAAWITALGGRSRLITARGTDLGARLITEELTDRGVQILGPIVPGSTGVVISISDSGRSRSMLTDRGVGTLLGPDALGPGWLDDCAWLHLTGYSLACEPIRSTALAAAQAATAQSVRLSLDLSSTALIEVLGVDCFRRLIRRMAPDVIFGNAAEAALIGNLGDEQLIVKLGAAGVQAAGRHYPALPTAPVDATGAGDAFAAGYLLGGVELGLAAAARAVARMGAMP